MGPERKSRIVSDETRRMTAYHEAGHAIVAYCLPDADPVHKITIIPRGRAGGATFTLPVDDRDEVSRDWVIDSMTMAMGGRVAETLILDRIGSGASSDIQQATKMARRMVTKWGMSEKLGPVAYGESEEQVFLGKDFGHQKNYSEATAQLIDDEVKRIIKECYQRAKSVLEENMDSLHKLAKALLERESMTGDELHLLMTGRELPPMVPEGEPKPAGGSDGSSPATAETSQVEPSDANAPAAEESESDSAASDVPPAAAKQRNPQQPPVKPTKADPEDFYGTQH
jgi:cell division protease FtsH